MSHDFGRGGAASAARIGGRSGAIFNTIARSRTSLLACASLIAVLTLGAHGQALAACGTITTGGGAHAAPSGGGSVHSGASTPHVSTGSGGGGCPSGNGGTGTKTGTITGGKIDLEGVHTWTHNTGNATTHNTGSGTHTRVANASAGTHIRRH